MLDMCISFLSITVLKTPFALISI